MTDVSRLLFPAFLRHGYPYLAQRIPEFRYVLVPDVRASYAMAHRGEGWLDPQERFETSPKLSHVTPTKPGSHLLSTAAARVQGFAGTGQGPIESV